MDDRLPLVPALALAFAASFGSVDRWRDEFVAMRQALAGGSGGLLLIFDPRAGRLVNRCATGHDAHAIAGGIPLLTLDAAEDDVDACLRGVDWAAVYERYQAAVTAASDGLAATADEAADARLIDVRRAAVFEQSDAMAEGAEWRDPASVDDWAAELPAERPVIVYCVYGHEVGRSTALRLRAAGVDARFLAGGFEGWRAQGRAVVDKRGR